MALLLKKLDSSMKERLDAYIADWKDEEIIPSTLNKYQGDIQQFVDYLDMMENDPPRLLVPGTLFFLVEDEEILGACEIRHFLNSGLLKYGGHMGYGVAPKHRGNGYAAKMIQLSMPFMKKVEIDSCLITCVRENVASAKSIINAGGVLENEVEIIRNGQPKISQRYWVDVK
ncbi:MAG: GNAT family N-acetyltransferase [Oscillospiraceae bacterium]|nr:GNAT family N-acetyltransferase [Oscillospiraceae bacterium]